MSWILRKIREVQFRFSIAQRVHALLDAQECNELQSGDLRVSRDHLGRAFVFYKDYPVVHSSTTSDLYLFDYDPIWADLFDGLCEV